VTPLDPEPYLARLADIRDAAQQRAYISNSEVAPTSALVEALSLKIRDIAWKDPSLAELLAESNLYFASQVDTPAAWAYATRSRAQVLHTMRRCAEAQPHFERAVQLFSEAGLNAEAGRTMVTEMENLAYLGRYEDAIQLEDPARSALEKVQDRRYLTLIEVSLGNLYYRLRRFSESLAHYERARIGTDDPNSTAAIGMGRAHVLSEMNRFDEALEAFRSTRAHCEQHGLSLWVDIVDRGLSRMYLHRGNYSAALQMLDQLRQKHEAANDSRRVALCDIDRAEIYLQLNLFEDASSVAGRAFELFEKLGNRYESALSLTFKGTAELKLLRHADAQRSFARARDLFVQEGNEIWVAAVDLWLAQLLILQKQFAQAGELARRSAQVFEKQQVPVRAANARVLSALTLQEMHETKSAIADAQLALQELEGFHAPWVSYQALNTLGRLRELEGDTQQAEGLYMRAIAELELLRGNIKLDELRMSFGKDKYQVYENIVNVKLGSGETRQAFDLVERSKSRTLLDLMERNLETAWEAGGDDSPRFRRIRKIREELNILYSRLSEAGAIASVAVSNKATKDEIARREQQLVELLRAAGSEKPGWATLQSMPSLSVDDVQNMLENDEVLVEYYAVGDRLQVFVIGRNMFHVVRDLSSSINVRTSLKGLNFQLSKFHLQSTYLKKHSASLVAAAQHHLGNLHAQLIAPISQLLEGKKHLVIVPHQMLHYVPFHALFDSGSYLIDRFTISYAASASVLRICRSRHLGSTPRRDLVLAVADHLTPHINEEVEALRQLLPSADIFVGAEADEDKLRQYAPTAGKIHIAAHGIFRSDNPMFSSIRLGNNWLNLFDIFNLKLGAEMTTLSACETGMSAVWEGDELLGLARGFLYAGTPSLVVSLWMVNDRSTAQLMRGFYEGLGEGLSKAEALRRAMLDVKAAFPHPYYWAPFILLGKS
jgi:CHAT domain-containing protein